MNEIFINDKPRVFRGFDTAGKPIFDPPTFSECDCGLTCGCHKCNPFEEFLEEDIKMAEMGMKEYNEILKKEDKEF